MTTSIDAHIKPLVVASPSIFSTGAWAMQGASWRPQALPLRRGKRHKEEEVDDAGAHLLKVRQGGAWFAHYIDEHATGFQVAGSEGTSAPPFPVVVKGFGLHLCLDQRSASARALHMASGAALHHAHCGLSSLLLFMETAAALDGRTLVSRSLSLGTRVPCTALIAQMPRSITAQKHHPGWAPPRRDARSIDRQPPTSLGSAAGARRRPVAPAESRRPRCCRAPAPAPTAQGPPQPPARSAPALPGPAPAARLPPAPAAAPRRAPAARAPWPARGAWRRAPPAAPPPPAPLPPPRGPPPARSPPP
mmetsp:Transcript_16483/g.42252  ORF Transcript_16483/g.42252 Transcript_16483/m.42252 type:complete len:305 (-) Transcript_16483:830-1744(-)